ncbi:MAG: gluconate 2-dehydrogenase subunit 3 family protein, partial [Aquabacterium sp.]|nr:gluconate 2-dehydrogenase subunit 3 family protein [Ferruginibacter sp.]
MDRRKSIKALLIGTASTVVLVESCKTKDKEKPVAEPTGNAAKLNEDDRMAEEKSANKI